jgi:beta-glucosidase
MTPMVTLHHFTNPVWFAERGGWLWDEAPQRFARFVDKVVATLGDLCELWCTINEPMTYTFGGYLFAYWLPQVQSMSATRRVLVNLMRGHAAAYHTIKHLQPSSQVGLTHHHVGFIPSAPVKVNRIAASIAGRIFNETCITALRDGFLRLPHAVHIPGLKGSVDWIGLQHYRDYEIGFDVTKPMSAFVYPRLPTDMVLGPGLWGGINPRGLTTYLSSLHAALNKPIFVSELGIPDQHDSLRPAYLVEAIKAIGNAIEQGVDVRGLFFWSLLDNFEWVEGYNPQFRFGLYQTDFETQTRSPKVSAALFGDICHNNGLTTDILDRYAQSAFATAVTIGGV